MLCCAGARARVGLTGLTVAEYFRDEEGQDVLTGLQAISGYSGGASGRRLACFYPVFLTDFYQFSGQIFDQQ